MTMNPTDDMGLGNLPTTPHMPLSEAQAARASQVAKDWASCVESGYMTQQAISQALDFIKSIAPMLGLKL
jgi:hypothetical protein